MPYICLYVNLCDFHNPVLELGLGAGGRLGRWELGLAPLNYPLSRLISKKTGKFTNKVNSLMVLVTFLKKSDKD